MPRVLGHRDTGRTACPGNLLYAQLGQLRTMVATGVGAAPAATARLSAALADTSIDYGETVPVTGVLTGPDGLALAAAPVDVQTNADGRWVTSKHLTTAPDGTFAGDLRPRRRMYVRLRFPGEADLRGATSARLLLRLHPVVTLARPPSRARRGARVALKGSVGPRKPWLRVMLQQRIRGRFKTRRQQGGARPPRPLRDLVRARLPGGLPLRGGGQVGRGHRPRVDRLAQLARALTHHPCLRSSE